jgi:hypothetical protein
MVFLVRGGFMHNIIYNFKSEPLLGCFLKLEDKIYWAVYFPDDGQRKMVFSANESSIPYIENFSETTIEKIKEVMNKYGFEVEPKEDFGEVLYFNNIPKNAIIYLRGYYKKINYEINLS